MLIPIPLLRPTSPAHAPRRRLCLPRPRLPHHWRLSSLPIFAVSASFHSPMSSPLANSADRGGQHRVWWRRPRRWQHFVVLTFSARSLPHPHICTKGVQLGPSDL